MSKVARYRKFIVALLGAAAVIGAEIPPDAPGWLTGTFAVLTALGVFAVRNAQRVASRHDLAGTRVADPAERRQPPTTPYP